MWLSFGLVLAVPGVFLAQAVNGQPPSLWEYGAIGAMAVVALGAVRVLWATTSKSLTEGIERERARADRLEEELRKLNTVIQERIVVALNDATRAVQEAMTTVRERR